MSRTHPATVGCSLTQVRRHLKLWGPLRQQPIALCNIECIGTCLNWNPSVVSSLTRVRVRWSWLWRQRAAVVTAQIPAVLWLALEFQAQFGPSRVGRHEQWNVFTGIFCMAGHRKRIISAAAWPHGRKAEGVSDCQAPTRDFTRFANRSDRSPCISHHMQAISWERTNTIWQWLLMNLHTLVA